eukprot:jgi/Mesvir1/15461/Mv11440-RA.2
MGDDISMYGGRGGRPSRGASARGGAGGGSWDNQLQQLELEAYTLVLKSFCAQSDQITWAKESVLTSLRKELNIADEQHRQLVDEVQRDPQVMSIKQYARGGGVGSSLDMTPLGSFSAKKKQKTVATPIAGPSAARVPDPRRTPGSAVQGGVSGGGVKRSAPGSRGKKGKGQKTPGMGAAAGANVNQLIGRKMSFYWPQYKQWFEAGISDFNPETNEHCVIYDMNTAEESFEWVNLAEMTVGKDYKFLPGKVQLTSHLPPGSLGALGTPAEARESRYMLNNGGRGDERDHLGSAGRAHGGLPPSLITPEAVLVDPNAIKTREDEILRELKELGHSSSSALSSDDEDDDDSSSDDSDGGDNN